MNDLVDNQKVVVGVSGELNDGDGVGGRRLSGDVGRDDVTHRDGNANTAPKILYHVQCQLAS